VLERHARGREAARDEAVARADLEDVAAAEVAREVGQARLVAIRGRADARARSPCRRRALSAVLRVVVPREPLGAHALAASASRLACSPSTQVDGRRDHRGHARARREDADEVQRIGRREHDALARARHPAHRAQRVDRARPRVLLAREARDEAPAARDAARLEPAQREQDLAPREREVLAREHVVEDHAPAREQLLGDALGVLVGLLPAAAPTSAQRPCAARPGRCRSRARAAPTGRAPVEELAQRRDPVRRDVPPATSSQSAGSTSDASTPARAASSAWNSAPPRSSAASTARAARSRALRGRAAAQRREQPRQVGALRERDRRRARRRCSRRAPRAGPTPRRPTSTGRRASAAGTRRSARAAPPTPTRPTRARAPELADRRERPARPSRRRARRDALPAQEEAHEVARADGLDLAAQTLLRVAVDAREQMARAHLGLAARGSNEPRSA
jgi:hypothetical protein